MVEKWDCVGHNLDSKWHLNPSEVYFICSFCNAVCLQVDICLNPNSQLGVMLMRKWSSVTLGDVAEFTKSGK